MPSGPTVTAPGDVLSTNVNSFREAIMPQVEALTPNRTLTIDLRASRLIDSVGLNLLVSAIKSARSRQGSITILVGNASVRRILSFTRIDTHATVVGPDLS
ncbi:STAS domain-containing protein [Actomonas aquatica]|uniref:STAS domain-containing protein n=1 Tax=Actomonas aquatica TaxID=2866162 RepID=A0ABZ1CDW7_9BACT|nr:STAS domain-containing protein [Opitutus sp. WL0086]WRQ89423.1 STAS domain-containing protein [Opitutus sp. WL0086]